MTLSMLQGYPPALLRLLGALPPDAFPAETRSTCSACPLWPAPGDDPTGRRTFTTVRCCTYHPSLPNFLVGLVLQRGGIGAQRVRARIAEVDGAYDIGLVGPMALRERYALHGDDLFGHDPSLACPFWVDGDLSCGIHESRGSVCRTWHCRPVAGLRGFLAWDALRQVLSTLEWELAERCRDAVGAPWPWAAPERWERFYLDCLGALDDVAAALDPATIPTLVGRRIGLHTALANRDRPLPDRLRTAPHVVEPVVNGTWRVLGWSLWDPVEAPPEVLGLLGRLAAGGAWQEAVEAEGGRLDEALVRALWRAEVLVDDGGSEG